MPVIRHQIGTDKVFRQAEDALIRIHKIAMEGVKNLKKGERPRSGTLFAYDSSCWLAVRLKHNKPSRTHPRHFFLKNDISLPTTFYGFLFRLSDG